MRRRAEGRIAAGMALLGLLSSLVGTACASESKSPLVADGSWHRIDVWEQRSSFDYDQVAAGSSPDAVAWLGRAPDDPAHLAYWEMRAGADAADTPLPAPEAGAAAPVIIPVATAVDDEGWVAVAVTRTVPRGANTGLLAWHGRQGRSVAAPQLLAPPPRVSGPPASVSAGRSGDHLAVAALYDGQAVVWAQQEATSGGTGAWVAAADNFDLDLNAAATLRSLRVVGDGSRLVLAGVDDAGAPHLWTSPDGTTWSAVADDHLPDKVGAVGLLTPLARGAVAVGWLDDEKSAPFTATSATIQRLTGAELADAGQLKASPDAGIERLHLAGATLSPEHKLVVVGGAIRSNGARTPMAWLRDGGEWHPTKQSGLGGHLDHEFRAVVTTRENDTMVAVATALEHPDVEAWQWRP